MNKEELLKQSPEYLINLIDTLKEFTLDMYQLNFQDFKNITDINELKDRIIKFEDFLIKHYKSNE